MDIISYNVIVERKKSNYGHVNNIRFKNKNWFKSSLIEMLEKEKDFMALQNKDKDLIKYIITFDLLDPNTIFELYYYRGEINHPILENKNEEYAITLFYYDENLVGRVISIVFNGVKYEITIYEDEKISFIKWVIVDFAFFLGSLMS